MSERPFLPRAPKPDDERLAAALGGCWPFYEDLRRATADFRHEWSHSKSSGWMEKLSRGGKALGYVIPLSGAFRVSMAVREEERAALLAARLPKAQRDLLAHAKAYREGHHVQLEVADEPSYALARSFLQRVMALR